MPYIPGEWIKDSKNIEQVHILLEKLDMDLQDTTTMESEVIRELTLLGETIIIEKLKLNYFYFGG